MDPHVHSIDICESSSRPLRKNVNGHWPTKRFVDKGGLLTHHHCYLLTRDLVRGKIGNVDERPMRGGGAKCIATIHGTKAAQCVS